MFFFTRELARPTVGCPVPLLNFISSWVRVYRPVRMPGAASVPREIGFETTTAPGEFFQLFLDPLVGGGEDPVARGLVNGDEGIDGIIGIP